jgi:hypothetical protein
MPWISRNGVVLEYPHNLAASAVLVGRDDVNEVVAATRKIFDEAVRLDRQGRDLLDELARLRQENVFLVQALGEAIAD